MIRNEMNEIKTHLIPQVDNKVNKLSRELEQHIDKKMKDMQEHIEKMTDENIQSIQIPNDDINEIIEPEFKSNKSLNAQQLDFAYFYSQPLVKRQGPKHSVKENLKPIHNHLDTHTEY